MLPSILISLGNCKWCLTARSNTKGNRGPDLTNSLLGVLLRFCQELVSLSSDIEAMFHPVMFDPHDVDTLKFPWWPDDDSSKEPVEYTFLVALLHKVGTILVHKKDGSRQCRRLWQWSDRHSIEEILWGWLFESGAVNWEICVSYCQEVDFDWLNDCVTGGKSSDRASSILDLDLNSGVLRIEITPWCSV